MTTEGEHRNKIIKTAESKTLVLGLQLGEEKALGEGWWWGCSRTVNLCLKPNTGPNRGGNNGRGWL